MSVCQCSTGDGCEWWTTREVASARKDHGKCPYCSMPIREGQACTVIAYTNEGEFGSIRYHSICMRLVESWVDEIGCELIPFEMDLHEASEHAAAHGDEDYWKRWLIGYGAMLEEVER